MKSIWKWSHGKLSLFFIIVVFAWRIFLEVLKLAFFYSSKKKNLMNNFVLNFPQMFLSNVCVEKYYKKDAVENYSHSRMMIVLYFERLWKRSQSRYEETDDQNFPICTSILFPSKLSGGEVMSSLEEGCYLQHD